MREMRELLDAKKYNELKEFISNTPLHKADAILFVLGLAVHGNKEMFQYYIDNVQWQDRRFNRNTLFEYNCHNILYHACKSGNLEFIKYLLELDVFEEGDKAFDDALLIPHHGILPHVFDFFAPRLEGTNYTDFVYIVRSVNHQHGDFDIVKHIDDKYFNFSNLKLYGALSIQCMKQYNSPETQDYNKYKSFVVAVDSFVKRYESMLIPGIDFTVDMIETMYALGTQLELPWEVQDIILMAMVGHIGAIFGMQCNAYIDQNFANTSPRISSDLASKAIMAEYMSGKKINEIVKF